MSDKFNVFDEWGNKVGEYTPTGGSGADGFLMVITLIFFWTIGFLCYALYRIIKQGYVAMRAKEYGKAILFLSPPWVTLIAVLIYLIGLLSMSAMRQVQLSYVPEKILINNINTNNTCGILVFTVTNNWTEPITVNTNGGVRDGDMCKSNNTQVYWGDVTINPKEQLTFYVISSHRVCTKISTNILATWSVCPSDYIK